MVLQQDFKEWHAVGQRAVFNWGNEFEESSSVSCRVSTLKNYNTSTSNASIDIISTMRQLINIYIYITYISEIRQKEDLITASSCIMQRIRYISHRKKKWPVFKRAY